MKNKKTPFQTRFGPFLPVLKQTRIFMKYPLVTFFLFLYFYCCAEFQKKTSEQIPRRVYRHTDRWTQRHMGKHEYIRPPLLGGLQKIETVKLTAVVTIVHLTIFKYQHHVFFELNQHTKNSQSLFQYKGRNYQELSSFNFYLT